MLVQGRPARPGLLPRRRRRPGQHHPPVNEAAGRERSACPCPNAAPDRAPHRARPHWSSRRRHVLRIVSNLGGSMYKFAILIALAFLTACNPQCATRDEQPEAQPRRIVHTPTQAEADAYRKLPPPNMDPIPPGKVW